MAAAWLPGLCACAVLVAACEGYYDTEGEVVGYCAPQHVDRVRPRDNSEEGYVDGWVFVALACPVDSGVITLRTEQDEPATGLVNLHHGGRQVRFHPSPRLRPLTWYDAHLDTPDGFHEWRFATSSLGGPAGVAIAGFALALQPWTGSPMDPPGLDEVLGEELMDFHPVVQFMAEPQGESVQARLGGMLPEEDGDPQDPSAPVIDLEAAWDDPFWRFGPVDLAWDAGGRDLLIEGAVFSGALASDLSGGGGIALQGTWDTRPAEPSLGAAICDTAAEAGQECGPCRDGEKACLPLFVVQAQAAPWSGMLEAP